MVGKGGLEYNFALRVLISTPDHSAQTQYSV